MGCHFAGCLWTCYERLSWVVTSLAVFGHVMRGFAGCLWTCHERLSWVVTSLADFVTCHERLRCVVTSLAGVGSRFTCCHCEMFEFCCGWAPQGKTLIFVHVLSLVNSTVNGFGRLTVQQPNTGGWG